MIDNQTGVVDIYRTLSSVYAPIRPLWARTINNDAEQYLNQVALPGALHPMARVLDLGCGPGINLARMRQLKLPFSSYVGIDLSLAMLTRAKSEDIRNHKYLLSDAYSLPFKAESFDVILSTWMFSHIAEPVKVIHESFRMLSPGGRMIVAFFSRGRGLSRSLQEPIESFFWVRCIPSREFQDWPGLVEMRSFAQDWNSIAILRKDARSR
jgi:ubiquinone/menaquinone biosynthesis C-methylase UbiE